MENLTIQEELIELLIIIQNLNSDQLKSFCQLVQPKLGNEAEFFPQINSFLSRATREQIQQLLTFCKIVEEEKKTKPRKEVIEPLSRSTGLAPSDFENSFKLLVGLHELQKLLRTLSILQLMKLFELMPQLPAIQQLQLLQQIQQLMAQLQPETLKNLHREMEKVEPSKQHQKLIQLLGLPSEYFPLYQPVRLLLQLDIEELLKLQETLPKISPSQMMQLLQLLQLQPFDVLELRNLFIMNPSDTMLIDSAELSQIPTITQSMEGIFAPPPPPSSDKKLSIQIVEQPPEKSVYKRNLKPNPMVMLVGDQQLNDGNLYVVPLLIRCDNFTEEAKFITGNKPMRVSSSRVMTFRKIKITTTSHQQQETLFCLRFELRRYTSEEDFEVLDSVHSNPISVLSHSTQMKPLPVTTPTISDVIPGYGPPTGGTRVAVLGSNFVDSPATRIRFDTTDVMPIYHGPGTLICHTPEHQPGTVSVRVCNSNKKWSDTASTFTYDDTVEPYPNQIQQAATIHRNSFEPSSITGAAWQGNFEGVRRTHTGGSGSNVNNVDKRSYTALHYACSQGFVDIAQYLLVNDANPNVKDKHGSTPLFWASLFGYAAIVNLLLQHGANVNELNNEGKSPLLVSCVEGHELITDVLLRTGARVNENVANFSPLHAVSARGEVNSILSLLSHGAFIDIRDDEDETPLFWAVREQKYDAVETLLKYGAYVNARNSEMETPIHLSVIGRDKRMVTLLLKYGATFDQEAKKLYEELELCGFQLVGKEQDKKKETFGGIFSEDSLNAGVLDAHCEIENYKDEIMRLKNEMEKWNFVLAQA